MRYFTVAMACALALSAPLTSAWAKGAVVLYGGNEVHVENVLKDPTDLWVTPEDLTRISGFELKPQGACLEDICIPTPPDSGLVVTRKGQDWFNVTGLAHKLNQAFTADLDKGVWSFGEIPATLSGQLHSAKAPDFSLTDRKGKTVSLSDFRGKKVLIVTWASW